MKKATLPVRFGIAISGSLIAFFLILSLFKLHTAPIYSLFNSVITGFGIYEAIKIHKLQQGKKFTYTSGFTVGIITGFVATAIFTVFFAFYISEIDLNFLEKLHKIFGGEYQVNTGIITFAVAIMGFATTVVLTLTFMQLFKRSRNML
jgi:Protein of unknown function (DUF4199)